MQPGETISSGGPKVCPDCDTVLVLKIMYSGAGYYVGTQCHCGPYSRESDYYPTVEAARTALETGSYSR